MKFHAHTHDKTHVNCAYLPPTAFTPSNYRIQNVDRTRISSSRIEASNANEIVSKSMLMLMCMCVLVGMKGLMMISLVSLNHMQDSLDSMESLLGEMSSTESITNEQNDFIFMFDSWMGYECPWCICIDIDI
jgi:hypothetical protein